MLRLRSAQALTIYALKPRFQAGLRPLTARLAALGITANQVTLAAIGPITFEKTITSGANPLPGGTVTYGITVRNGGAAPAMPPMTMFCGVARFRYPV